MQRGTVIIAEEKRALILFEGQNIQKHVKIPRHITDLKAGDRLPISLSKFGNFIRPHLNAKEVEKLLINDIMLDDKGQNIVDIITKD